MMDIKQEPEAESEKSTDLNSHYGYTDIARQHEEKCSQVKTECLSEDEDFSTPDASQHKAVRDGPIVSTDASQELPQQMKVYSCSMCQYSCDLLYELYKHRVSHLMQQTYMCDLCQYPYEFFLDLKSHLVSHIVDVNLSPELCYGDSQYLKNTQESQELEQRNENIQHSRTDKQGLNLQVVKHEGEKALSCDECSYTCSSEQDLKMHTESHLSGLPTTSSLYEMHKSQVPNEKSCQKKFKHISQRAKHLRTHLAKKEKPYSCDLCDFSFARPSDLQKHQRTHTGEKPYSCDHCDFTCARMSYLRRHQRKHTGEKPYSCDFCDYICANNTLLKRHQMTHTGEKPYSCNFCDYTSAHFSNLKYHQRTHTGEKPYSCDLCDFTCARPSDLERHQRKHTGEKPFSCDFCDYTCAYISGMKCHQRKHTGEKPYSCDVCDYKCAHSSQLKQHQRSHTGEKPYSCDLCDYTCAYISSLRCHKRKHTGEKQLFWDQSE